MRIGLVNMPLQLTVHHGPLYLLVGLKRTAQLADLRGMVALAAAVCAAAPYRRCLFDLWEMQTDLAFSEQIHLGTYAGESLRNLDKVASVLTPAQRTGICANAAQNLGARLRVFTDIEDAKAWIST